MSSDLPASGNDASEGDGTSRPADASHSDPMAPPEVPCECSCLHCGRVFMSDQMWFQRVIGDRSGFEGFWMCPTPNCGGAGFTFDIFPTDPNHPANEGWHSYSDEEDWTEEGEETQEAEWDPEEPEYQPFGEEEEYEDDLEGEEWKYGLEPGEHAEGAEPQWMQEARQRWEEEQKKYDEPDQRPRELDWSNREDREPRSFSDDDIPF